MPEPKYPSFSSTMEDVFVHGQHAIILAGQSVTVGLRASAVVHAPVLVIGKRGARRTHFRPQRTEGPPRRGVSVPVALAVEVFT